MTLQAPLAVRIIGPLDSYQLGPRLLEDVQIKNAAPGGYTSCNVSLTAPIDVDQPELAAYQSLEVVDTRNGEQVWFGRLEDPGRQSGKVWSLGAVGGSAHASDVKKGVVYQDTRVDVWTRYDEQALPGATIGKNTESTDAGVDDPPWVWAFPRGTVVPATGRSVMRYDLLRDTGQWIGRVAVRTTGGKTSAAFEQQWVGRGGPATEANLVVRTLSTTEGTMQAYPGSGFAAGALHRVPELRFYSTNAVTVADDLTWNECRGTRVVGTRVDRYGTTIHSAAAPYLNYTYPHQVAEDVLGRFLAEFDAGGSVIDTTSPVQITQMAYEDGTTAADILNDLMVLAPTHWWAAWGNVNGAGAVFEWQPWPTTIALDNLNARADEFSATGSNADLYNEVMVRYKDPNGRTRSLLVTAANPTLTNAGLTRRSMLDLGSQIGDKAQALSAGQAFLAAHATPGNSGTLKVSRPVIDAVRGRRIWPWQLRAGVLCRVDGVQPKVDDLNPTPNGSTVFRVSDVSYSAKSGEATLTLDSYDRTVARALASLAARQSRQRRL